MSESEPGSAEKRGVLVGVVPERLAIADERPLPESVNDDAHEQIAKQAIEWQGAAGKAQLWEAGAAGKTEEGRPYELAGLMASAGEQLALAYAGAVEVALWQEVRQGSDPDPADEVSLRGMVESQCLFVMGTGHGGCYRKGEVKTFTAGDHKPMASRAYRNLRRGEEMVAAAVV